MKISYQQAIKDVIGGELYPELVIWGYCNAIFPMADEGGNVVWFCPLYRGIIELKGYVIPRTLRATIRQGKFAITADVEFERVIRLCADREQTWINEEIIDCYLELHNLGYAHSIETWDKSGNLAGGLYGVAIGGAFFGESMFHLQKDASKVALVGLISQLRKQDFDLLDTQWLTEHLARMGGTEIIRTEYLIRLKQALERKCYFTDKTSTDKKSKTKIEIDTNLFCGKLSYG